METVECPQHLVGRVIGKGGETIRDLQARSGYVELLSFETSHHFQHQIVVEYGRGIGIITKFFFISMALVSCSSYLLFLAPIITGLGYK